VHRREKWRLVLPYLLPALVLHTLFFTVPVLQSPYFSLTDWNGMTPATYIGIENYRTLIGDTRWWIAVRNTLWYAVVSGVLGLALGLLFAVAAKGMRRGVRLTKFIIFVPSILPTATIALLWLFIYNPQFGLLNGMLRMVGLGILAKPWMGDNATVLPAITIASVWAGVGGTMILFLAGLNKIPSEYYEAGEIDGANPWQLFWNVTWPLLWEITHILIILAIIGGLQAFGLFFFISGGNLREASQVTGTYLFQAAFRESRYGYATTIGVVLFVAIMGVTVLSNRLLRRDAVEY
jgi:ABC-type sugar transport system permease subunit